MSKYIDADRLKAEIERHIKEVKEAENRFHSDLGFFDAKLSGIYDTLSIIDSLQQEQPDFPTTDKSVEEFLSTHPKVEVPGKYKTPDFVFKNHIKNRK